MAAVECSLFQIHVSEHHIAESLSPAAPIQHQQCQQSTLQLMNPIPYRVTAHREKLHLDQNEKVIMYEMTHVVAIDGYSRKIVGFIILPAKNVIAIYDCLLRPLLLKEGLWVQVRVDHGREFSLMLSVQQGLASFRVRQDRVPYLQTVSRENHQAEQYKLLSQLLLTLFNLGIATVAIPGRAGGIPNHLRRNDHLKARIPSHAVPPTGHAVMQF